MSWQVAIDTAKPSAADDAARVMSGECYALSPRTLVLMLAS